MSDEVRYELTLTGDQALLIAGALDFWGRIHSGQVFPLEEVGWRSPADGFKIDTDRVRGAAESFRAAVFPDLHGGASRLDFRGGKEAFNLRKLLEHAVSWTEKPPEDDRAFLPVNYNGPLAGWWEGPPASIRVVNGDARRKVRDNQSPYLLGKKFASLIGTDDLEEALGVVTEWKSFYEKCRSLEGERPELVHDQEVNVEDLWNLDHTLATIIHRHLVAFRAGCPAYPASLTPQKWEKYLLQMERAFELLSREVPSLADPAETKEIDKGFSLFKKYFQHLWW